MVIVMFALSLPISKIFAKLIKYKSLTLKMKIQLKEEKNGTCAIRLDMFDSNFSYFGTYFYAKGNTHTQSERQW